MDKELKKQLKATHRCIHCRKPLLEGYTQESCERCKRILKRAAREGGWRWKLFVEILDHYGWVCACCGEDIPEFLTVGHKARGGNLQRDEIRNVKKIHEWYRWIVDSEFPDDLQMECYNCNLGKERIGGEMCPHELDRSCDEIL